MIYQPYMFRFMAPELMLNPYQEFTPAADVYSFAICLYEVYTGTRAYETEDQVPSPTVTAV